MPRLSLLAWRSLGSSPLRSALTAAAVALGVAMVMAALTANRTIERNLVEVAHEVVGAADLEVRAFREPGLSQESLEGLRALPGVEEISPFARKRTFYRTPEVRGFLELVGIEPIVETRVHSYHLAEGVFLADEANDTVLLVAGWAAARGLETGDVIELVTVDGFQPFRIIGLLSQAGIAEDRFGRVALVSLKTAQEAFGLGDRAGHVSVMLAPGASADAVEERLPEALREDYLVLRPPEIETEILTALSDLRPLLLVFAAVALFVATFLIYNTIGISVAERVRLLGLLRAVGTTDFQIVRLVLAEAAILGLQGGIVGILAGAWVAGSLSQVLAGLQEVRLETGAVLAVEDAAVSLALGVGLAVLAGFVPAVRASRVSPVEAMRPYLAPLYLSGDPSRWVWGPAVAILGLALANLGGTQSGPVGVLGIFLLCVGIVPLTEPLVGPLSRVAELPLRFVPRRTREIGRRNLERTPARTTLTVGAFAVAVATGISLVILALSTWAAGTEWVRGLFPGPWVVVSPVTHPVSLIAELEATPGVTEVRAYRRFPVNWEGRSLEAVGLDLAEAVRAGRPELIEGDPAAILARLSQGDHRLLLIPRSLAVRFRLSVGDPLSLKTGEGTQDFEVAGIIARSFPGITQEGAVLLPTQSMVQDFGYDGFDLLNLETEGDPETLGPILADQAELYGMELVTVEEMGQAVRQALVRLFLLLGVTAIAAVAAGTLGMANTMIANVNERRREIGTLRAAGMTVEQVMAMVLAEAGIMGGVASLLGAGMSALLALAMLRFLQAPDFAPALTVPWAPILGILLLPPIIAVLASIYPARRVATAPLIRSLRDWT